MTCGEKVKNNCLIFNELSRLAARHLINWSLCHVETFPFEIVLCRHGSLTGYLRCHRCGCSYLDLYNDPLLHERTLFTESSFISIMGSRWGRRKIPTAAGEARRY